MPTSILEKRPNKTATKPQPSQSADNAPLVYHIIVNSNDECMHTLCDRIMERKHCDIIKNKSRQSGPITICPICEFIHDEITGEGNEWISNTRKLEENGQR